MAGEDDHLVSPHPVVHVHGRPHGSSSSSSSRSSSRSLAGGRAASPRRGGNRVVETLCLEGSSGSGGGVGSSSNNGSRSRRHHHVFSISRIGSTGAVYTRSSSTSSDEDFWPHRTSPSRSTVSISSNNIANHIHNPSSSGSGSNNSAHTSLRLAFQSRGGGTSGRGERADVVVGGEDQQSAFGWGAASGAGGRGGDGHHGHRRSSLFLSLVDSEGSSRSRSIEHCLEGVPEPSFGAMLPGVEVARRRRVRLAETYEGGGGGGFGGGGHHQEAGQSSRSSRSSASGVTVAHHHHYHHHHHHHHVHHQAARHPSRPGTPRPGSLVRRMCLSMLQQDILQEHRARSPFQQISNTAGSSSSSSSTTDRTIALETNNSTQSSSHHRSSRGHGHRIGDGESRISPLSSLWRRQPSDSSSNLRGAALEARNRLDERLRAAAHASHSRRSWQAVQSSYDMNLHFSDEEEDNFWSDDDGGETSLNEWLAVWAPTAWAPTSLEERWSRMESPGSGTSSSSRNPAFKPRPSEGLSKAAINALPRQIVGSSRNQGANNRSKMEQEDCPVCLEGFLPGQSLMTLPCHHRFHPECLTPWLQNHGQCPYCRADIVKDIDTSSDHKTGSRLVGGSDEELLSWVEAIERGMDRLSYS
ncbi:unnamed protein product [Calypogeia fissa]